MNTLTPEEIALILSALRYTTAHGYVDQSEEELKDYHAMHVLIDKLEA